MLALADGLDRARYASRFIVSGEGRFAAALRARGLPVTVIDLTRLVSVGALLELARELRRDRPDLLHTAGARASFYGRLAARLAGVRGVISSVHTSIADYEVPAWRRALYLRLDRASARLAQRIIATSEAVAADLVARGQVPAEKLVTIPNRPDPRDLVPTRPRDVVRGELGAGAADALIGVIARLTEQKGVADFLESLARLAQRPGWQAVVVGDGPQRAALEADARRLGLSQRCRFVGTCTDLGDVLSALDLLVVPSRSEGLPYVVLEAMVVGTPLVATSVGGIPEVVIDGVRGVLVPPRAPDRLAAELTAALENPSKSRALADAAQRYAATALSLEAMLDAVAAVYRTVLGEAMAK